MNKSSVKIVSAAVSDRGLSEKRPLNEDSFLADAERRIFAVADGVGGAQAGEVASQTAVEVLDEAFRHHDDAGDVEDLMELAIQRANSSIHRMAQEHPKLQMMATTIVALHLDGNRATIGHVGDSRLYRVTPDGKIHRDTRDHSVVEEEVRAGRMTPAQAAHHPSRNVISRALGAEEGVEVDMKIIEVSDGTTFLLCSDGITRHIPDDELLSLLNRAQELDATCEEMKRLCYERGAEDNLTAVIVRVGERPTASDGALVDTMSGEFQVDDPSLHETVDALRPLSPSIPDANASQPESQQADEGDTIDRAPVVTTAAPPRGSSFGTFAGTLFFLILALGIGAAAFYGGMYKQRQDSQAAVDQTAATPTLVPAQPVSDFERRRREVDAAPAKVAERMSHEQGNDPMASHDPEFLYLYGRALLLSGKYADAITALGKASDILKATSARDPLKIDMRLAAVAAAMKSGNGVEREKAAAAFEEVLDPSGKTLSNGQGNGNGKKSSRGINTPVSPPIALPR